MQENRHLEMAYNFSVSSTVLAMNGDLLPLTLMLFKTVSGSNFSEQKYTGSF